MEMGTDSYSYGTMSSFSEELSFAQFFEEQGAQKLPRILFELLATH